VSSEERLRIFGRRASLAAGTLGTAPAIVDMLLKLRQFKRSAGSPYNPRANFSSARSTARAACRGGDAAMTQTARRLHLLLRALLAGRSTN
jgi:hypothetical protein